MGDGNRWGALVRAPKISVIPRVYLDIVVFEQCQQGISSKILLSRYILLIEQSHAVRQTDHTVRHGRILLKSVAYA